MPAIVRSVLPGGSDVKESTCNTGDPGQIPGDLEIWRRKIPWRREWLPHVFLSGKFHGQRSLADYSLWGHRGAWQTIVYGVTEEPGRLRVHAVTESDTFLKCVCS